MSKRKSQVIYANDATESVGLLLRLRLPWLIVGLFVGAATTLAISKFEQVLAAEVRLAFFIPLIVYLSDAVGTQTETIFVRNSGKRKLSSNSLVKYFIKEFMLGILLGAIFGALAAVFAWTWLKSWDVALTVGLAMLASVSSATIIALVTSVIIKNNNQDPAIGAGPFTTVIQDFVSLMIYFLIASLIIL